MKPSFTRLITTIAAIIVIAWLAMLAFRVAAWLINGLVAIAAVVLVVMVIYRFARQKPASSKKASLKIEREPSKEKK